MKGIIGYYPLMCFHNGGSVRDSIPAGKVTLGQVLAVVPFGVCVNKCVVLSIAALFRIDIRA